MRIEIIGNLGADPEQRNTQAGAVTVSMRVAVNSQRKGPDGEQVERTDWFRVRSMGARAEYLARFRKGQRVLVIGRLEIGEYQAREGGMRTSFDVWADDVVNLSPRDDAPNGQEQRPATGEAARPPSAAVAATEQNDLEDLPF